MGSKRNVNMSDNTDVVKIVGDQAAEGESQASGAEGAGATEGAEQSDKKTKKTALPRRSRKYVAARAQVDKTKLYDAFAAVELVKKLSYSSFTGTITADVLVRDVGHTVNITFPHTTGKSVRVAVVNDELLAKVEAGTIDFDVLISEPRFMPKLAKLARILGPRGLMPNPKNGTLTPNPEAKRKELEGGMIQLKTEKKQPVMHVVIGKVDMDTAQLVANIQALITALDTKLVRLTTSSTMSPGVKVKIG